MTFSPTPKWLATGVTPLCTVWVRRKHQTLTHWIQRTSQTSGIFFFFFFQHYANKCNKLKDIRTEPEICQLLHVILQYVRANMLSVRFLILEMPPSEVGQLKVREHRQQLKPGWALKSQNSVGIFMSDFHMSYYNKKEPGWKRQLILW